MQMPSERPFGIYISQEEKNAAILRMTIDLKAWRERNPDAPKGRPVPLERDEEGEGLL